MPPDFDFPEQQKLWFPFPWDRGSLTREQGRVWIWGRLRPGVERPVAEQEMTSIVAQLARAHGLPFYVAAPGSTFDLTLVDGGAIPIEERDAGEVTELLGTRIAPEGIEVYNPAFDVTPRDLVTAIITEFGVIEHPDRRRIRDHFPGYTRTL